VERVACNRLACTALQSIRSHNPHHTQTAQLEQPAEVGARALHLTVAAVAGSLTVLFAGWPQRELHGSKWCQLYLYSPITLTD
jgi:hypothetical protein